MNQSCKRMVVFDCLMCLNPSYQPEPEIDFGKGGKHKIPVCGGCMRTGDENKIIDITVRHLVSAVPPSVVEVRMKEVLSEYRELPQQGS